MSTLPFSCTTKLTIESELTMPSCMIRWLERHCRAHYPEIYEEMHHALNELSEGTDEEWREGVYVMLLLILEAMEDQDD